MKSFCISLCLVWCGVVNAAVINTDGSLADAQAKYNGASSGDTILWPLNGGPFGWNNALSINNSKSITLNANKSSVIHSGGYTGTLISQSGAGSATNHYTGFTFNDTATTPMLTLDGTFTNSWFWLDQCTFTCPNNPAIFVYVYQSWGLINSNTFAAPSNSEMIHVQAWNPSLQTNGWTDDILPNSIYAVYIENNTFTNNMAFGNPAFFFGNSAWQGYYGCRVVGRTNTFSMSQIDNHGGAVGLLGGRWWELYENTFYTVPNANQSSYMGIRSGSGVVFNNHQHGPNAGAGNLAFALQGPDWNLDPPGTGKNFLVVPFYCWNNDVSMTFSTDQPGTSYFLTPRTPPTLLWSGLHPFLANGFRLARVTTLRAGKTIVGP